MNPRPFLSAAWPALLCLVAAVRAAEIVLPEVPFNEDEALVDYPVPLAGTGTADPQVSVRVESQTTGLFPTGAITVRGSGSTRWLTAVPAANQAGEAWVTLELREGRGSPPPLAGSVRLPLRVRPVNDPPEIQPVPDQRWFVNGLIPPIPLSVSDVDGEAQVTGVGLVSSTAMPVPRLALRRNWPTPSTTSLVSTDPSPLTSPGALTYRVQATDAAGASNSITFNALVEPAWLVAGRSGSLPAPRVPIELVDINRDGHLDLHIQSSPAKVPPVSLWQTNGSVFGAQIVPGPEAATILGAWGDLNGDGRPDLVQPSPPDRVLVWATGILSRGREMIQVVTNSGLACSPRSRVAVGDLDGDGDQDVLLSTPGPVASRSTVLLRNDGDGRLSALPCGLAQVGGIVRLGDVDNDGDLDALILSQGTSEQLPGVLSLHLNDGRGVFSPSANPVPTAACWNAGLVDYDGDGVLDLWILEAPMPRARQVVELRRGGAAGYLPGWRFEGMSEFSAEFRGEPAAPVFGDFDNDGRLDVLVPGTAGGIVGWFVHRQLPGGGFLPVTLLPGSPLGAAVAAGDLDRNGSLDVIYPQPLNRLTFTNVLPFPNPPPTAPTGLRATRLAPGLLRLSWNPATDLNQSAPLTYNVRMGRQPGAHDLVPALSRPDGIRLLLAPGNAGYRREVILQLPDLERDRIHWSVQAIDVNGTASAFAPEQNLSDPVPGIPPSMSTLAAIVFNEDEQWSGDLVVSDNTTPASAIRLVARVDDPELASVSWYPIDGLVPGVFRCVVAGKRDRSGQSAVEFLATDLAGLTTTNRVPLIIRPVNDLPVISWAPAPWVQYLGEDPALLELEVFDPETPLDQLRIQVSSSDELRWPSAQVAWERLGSNRLRILRTGRPTLTGAMSLNLSVEDADGTVARQVVRVEILPRLPGNPVRIAAGPVDEFELADIDGDGDLDLARVEGDGSVAILRQDGAAGWVRQLVESSGSARLLRWTELNGDSRPDLLLTAGSPTRILALLNVGGSWSLQTWGIRSGAGPAAWADLDGDGRPELVEEVVGAAGGTELRSISSSGTTRLAPLPAGVQELFPGDWDGDGESEILVSTDTGWRWLHRRREDGAWQLDVLPWPTWDVRTVRAGDFDRDGLSETYLGLTTLIRVDPPPSTGVWGRLMPGIAVAGALRLDGLGMGWLGVRGDGLLFWSRMVESGAPEMFPLAAEAAWNPRVADVDANGSPDIVTWLRAGATDPTSTELVWLRNPNPPGSPPTAPIPVPPRMRAGETLLRWDPAADHATNGCTYDLRVGSAPGLADVASVGARSDGRRFLPVLPNTTPAVTRRIRGLQPGRTYYWAVQAVSGDGVGGPFSAEQSFTVPKEWPATEAAQTLLLAERQSGGGMRLKVEEAPSGSGDLQESDDLLRWRRVRRYLLDGKGRWNLDLDAPPEGSHRFYRVRPD